MEVVLSQTQAAEVNRPQSSDEEQWSVRIGTSSPEDQGRLLNEFRPYLLAIASAELPDVLSGGGSVALFSARRLLRYPMLCAVVASFPDARRGVSFVARLSRSRFPPFVAARVAVSAGVSESSSCPPRMPHPRPPAPSAPPPLPHSR